MYIYIYADSSPDFIGGASIPLTLLLYHISGSVSIPKKLQCPEKRPFSALKR